MPAPLGKTPTRKMPDIQVFGLADSQATRSAIRFFRERRIVVSFVDLSKKPIAPSELRRFADRLGPAVLLVAECPDGVVARVPTDPNLLRLPLVRYGEEVTAGKDETTWRAWLAGRTGSKVSGARPPR
jgi:arsenate reductase (glutaredoxin)